MAFNINEFRSQMQGDGARPNLFEVTLPFPAFSLPGNASTKMSFMCRSAQLPGSTVNSIAVNYFGRELKFAGNRTFADWSVTIINDEDFVIRNAFERWMNGLNSHNLNLRSAGVITPSNYTVDGEVRQYGKAGNILKKYRFIGLFPTDISTIDVDWGSNDAIEEFTVNLTYQWWESVEAGVV
jgi:hypothetical protein